MDGAGLNLPHFLKATEQPGDGAGLFQSEGIPGYENYRAELYHDVDSKNLIIPFLSLHISCFCFQRPVPRVGPSWKPPSMWQHLLLPHTYTLTWVMLLWQQPGLTMLMLPEICHQLQGKWQKENWHHSQRRQVPGAKRRRKWEGIPCHGWPDQLPSSLFLGRGKTLAGRPGSLQPSSASSWSALPPWAWHWQLPCAVSVPSTATSGRRSPSVSQTPISLRSGKTGRWCTSERSGRTASCWCKLNITGSAPRAAGRRQSSERLQRQKLLFRGRCRWK